MKSFQIPFLIFIMVTFLYGCHSKSDIKIENKHEQYITILGIAQDAGYPQINCNKECCQRFYEGKESKKLVSCLGLVDRQANTKYLFDATPDMTAQTQLLKENHLDNGRIINGVFLTHAHIGHYTGLMNFGRESMGSQSIPVYVMPRMASFLTRNGPWSQLVELNNIVIRSLQHDSTISLNNNLKVTPFLVPHRDEFSETVGYKIEGKNKSALYIPDIDKWELWDRSIVDEVKKVDYAIIDATFFKNGEISRPMRDVPHPFIEETADVFKNESKETKSKIIFIHFNHTNPALLDSHPLKERLQNIGFKFAKEGMILDL